MCLDCLCLFYDRLLPFLPFLYCLHYYTLPYYSLSTSFYAFCKHLSTRCLFRLIIYRRLPFFFYCTGACGCDNPSSVRLIVTKKRSRLTPLLCDFITGGIRICGCYLSHGSRPLVSPIYPYNTAGCLDSHVWVYPFSTLQALCMALLYTPVCDSLTPYIHLRYPET